MGWNVWKAVHDNREVIGHQEEMEVNIGREKEATAWISQKDISQK